MIKSAAISDTLKFSSLKWCLLILYWTYQNKFILKNSSVNFLKHALPKQVRLSLTKDGSS